MPKAPKVGKCLLCQREKAAPDEKSCAGITPLADTKNVDATQTKPVTEPKTAKPKARKPIKLSTKINKLTKKVKIMFKLIKLAVLVVFVSCFISAWPSSVTNTASAVLWTANKVNNLTYSAIDLVKDAFDAKVSAKDSKRAKTGDL